MFCHSPDGATVIVVLAMLRLVQNRPSMVRRCVAMVIMVMVIVMTILAIKFAEPSGEC